MAMAERADLVARLSLKDDFSKGLRGAEGSLRSSMGRMGGIARTGIKTAVASVATVGLIAAAGITAAVKGGLASLATLESAITSVDGAIKQVGLTGKVTGAQIAGWANEIEASVGAAFDDKDITQAATTLIRFGKVTSANLRPALVVMTDLATKTGSVESAASLLAKALADPAKAAGKLARAGVILTKEQQAQIKAMVAAGDAAGAQKVLLDALAKATNGAALASQGPYQRSLSVLKDVTEDAQRALATGFLPVIERVRDILSRELAKQSTLDNLKAFGQGIAGGLDSLVTAAQGVDWGAIGSGLKTAGQGAKAIFDAFMGLPPDVKGILIGLTALNKLSGGGVIKIGVDILTGAGGLLFQQFLGRGSIANPMVVIPVGGSLGAGPGLLPTGGGLAGLLSGGLLAISLAAIVPAVLVSLTEAILGGTEGILKKDIAGRTETNIARGGSGAVPTGPLRGGGPGAMNPTQWVSPVQRSLDTVRRATELSRIGVTTAIRAEQSALMSRSIGEQTAIVAAIRGIQRPIVSVSVVGNRVTTTYATGTTLSRNINPNVLALT